MEGELKLCRRIKKKNQLISYRVKSIDFFSSYYQKKFSIVADCPAIQTL